MNKAPDNAQNTRGSRGSHGNRGFLSHRGGVCHQFDRAAGAYAGEASLQRGLAHRLVSLLPETIGTNTPPPQSSLTQASGDTAPNTDMDTDTASNRIGDFRRAGGPSLRVLDAGAGTGFAGRAIQQRLPHSTLYYLDIAPSMLKCARDANEKNHHHSPDQSPNLCYPNRFAICGDLERLPFAPGAFHIVTSSAALHWCQNWKAALHNMCSVLPPDGYLLLATFCAGTLQEVARCWQFTDKYRHVMDYPSTEDILSTVAKHGLRIETVQCQHETVIYPDARTLFATLKRLGTGNRNPRRPQGLTPKSHLDAVLKKYDKKYRARGGVRASYEVMLLRARLASS